MLWLIVAYWWLAVYASHRSAAHRLPYNGAVTRRPLRPTAEFDGTTYRNRPPGEAAARAVSRPYGCQIVRLLQRSQGDKLFELR